MINNSSLGILRDTLFQRKIRICCNYQSSCFLPSTETLMSLTLRLWVELRPHTCQILTLPPNNTSGPLFGILWIRFELAWSLSRWQAQGAHVNDEVAWEGDAFLEGGKRETGHLSSDLHSPVWHGSQDYSCSGKTGLKKTNRFFIFWLLGTLIPSGMSWARNVRNRRPCLCSPRCQHCFSQYSWPFTHRGPFIAILASTSQTYTQTHTQDKGKEGLKRLPSSERH